FILCLIQVSASGQAKTVSGKVSNVQGESIPGVAVMIKGTTQGTITDSDGVYSFSNVPGDATLVFSFVGMKTQEVVVGNKNQVNVSMEDETIGLDEIVTVGYGTQKKVNLTGSVATVQSEEIVKVPTANVSEVLTGKAPGLFTKQDQGVPGSDYSTISIRGYDTPLILVDGIETSWTRMDPNEIESISVLKDAAAAVYGARAGNGVILITTKRGTTNKPSIIYTSNYTFQNPTTIPEFVSSGKYTELLREGEFNSNLPYTYSEEDVQKFYEGTEPGYVNENWYKAAFREWAPMQSHNLAVRGGNEKVKYYMSVGYLDQSSIYQSGDLNFNRYNARTNVDAQISDRLSVSIDMSYRNEMRKAPQTSLDNIWINLKTALPVWPATLPDPEKGGAYSGFLERSPVAQTIRDMTGFNDDIQRYFTGKISAKYKIPGIDGLEANAALNYSINNKYNKIQDKPFDLFTYDYANQQYIPYGSNGANSLDETSSQYTQLYPMISLNYDKTFGNHSVQGFLLAEGINTDYFFLSAGRVDLLSVEVPYLFAGSPDNLTNNGGAVETGRISYVGRGNYSYKGKYLLEGTFRFDASHKFPDDSRWGFFPSVSAGWRVSEESFIKDNLSWVDNLKLRASYSKSGNDNVEAFKYLTGYEIQTEETNVYVFGSDVYRLIRSTGMPNPDITWLDMTSYNVGLDGTFMRGMLGFEFDLFYRVTDNIFGQPLETYPSTFGATLPQVNLNSTDDRGFELTLTHRNKIGNDFSYNVAGSVSIAREKYKRWSESPYNDEDEIRIYQKTGKYTNRWIGYKSDGLFMTQEDIDNHAVDQDQAGNTTLRPGDIKYIDRNDDKIIDWRDQDVIGYGTFPDLTCGLNIQMQYKGFSLTALFQGASLFNSMISDVLRGPLQNLGNPFEFQYKYRWQPDPANPDVNINPDAKLPAVLGDGTGTNTNNNKASDFWLQDATYLRLKNLNISYSLPGKIIKSFGIQDVNVYVAGSNLFTLSKLGIYKSSVDPEATGYQKFYPPVKTISFGLNVTL
ncbi:MAG: TonB-dependent receptor, partial [Prolixibacteraceae bacterium]|nr:TonB-dependent receptor [Prolixibacteraceae bacterium]